MSQEGMNHNDVARLQAKLGSLQALAANELTRCRKKQKLSAILGIGICFCCALALGNVTRLMFQLDANALSQIGRSELERRLPEGRANATSFLSAEAPRLVASAVQTLIDLVPQLRELVFAQLQDHGRTMMIEFETRLVQEMQQIIESTRKQIDAEMPTAKPEEKIVRLTAIVADQFHGNMSEVIQALYPDYAREIEQVRVYLEHLRTTEEAKLTPKERTHKEIIRTMLRIAVREQASHKVTG